jgi:hypothetical protein
MKSNDFMLTYSMEFFNNQVGKVFHIIQVNYYIPLIVSLAETLEL